MVHEILNGVELLLEPAENYLQVNDVTEDDLRGIWPHLLEKFPGNEAFFCFRNVPIPMEYLTKIGGVLLDDNIELRLSVSDFEKHAEIGGIANGTATDGTETHNIAVITPENFDAFAKAHDTNNPDMYWTSRRIRERMDVWRIFACANKGIITDYIMVMHPLNEVLEPHSVSEIFCCQSKDTAKAKALLTAAALSSFANGVDEILYMIDKDEEICKNATVSIGFRECGFYQGYKVILPAL